MGLMKQFLVCLAIAGCASAGKGNSIIGGLSDGGVSGGGRDDGGDFPAPDAALIDAPPQQITLSQTLGTTITRDNSIICANKVTEVTAESSYFRVFALDDYNITTTLHVTEVGFAIELADAGLLATLQPARVKLGSYGVAPSGTTLDPAQIHDIASVDIMISDGEGTRMTAPITADISPGTRLVVELALPNGEAASSAFVIGCSAQGENAPGYFRAPDCNVKLPTTIDSVIAGEVDVIMTVTGTR
jgi:hypothetical protein